MKNLIALFVVALFTTATFAQDQKMDASPAPASTTKSDNKMMMSHDHMMYMMKDGQLMKGMGDKWEALKETVTLKNGTMLMANGDWKMKDGKGGKLEASQCVDMMGNVGDCGKMMKMSEEHMMKEDKK